MAGRRGDRESVRVAATVVAAAQLHLDQSTGIRGKGRIVIEQVSAGACNLAVVIAGIADENRHEAAGTGWPLGQGAW